MRRVQRGVALLVVLWACTLLAILVGGFAGIARVEALQTRYTLGQQRARYAAEAAIMRAIVVAQARRQQIMRVQMGDASPRDGSLPGDGRSLAFVFDRVHVAVAMLDESGKVDINSAEPRALKALFVAAGCRVDRADQLTRRILEWRGPTMGAAAVDGVSPVVASAGNPSARYTAFAAIEELQGLPGMDDELYSRLEPAITIWSGQPAPQPDFASVLAMAAVRGIDLPSAREIVRARDSVPPGTPLTNLPGGIALGGALPGNTMTFRANADDGHGGRATVEATVRFPFSGADRVPGEALYTVLRWRDGPASSGGAP
ncbi:general secretion pathway protein GspK [Luteibacter yeojuensis]|uniref:General secretion pathway protein GspK n=1 Tax=Luteibacter yeojuensis TaxID=345309 RepID=A0A7X5QT22_9GAMM|nr:type II secretion system protein GspK [Luteibacter yeojuensis]NID14905.1 general secretion pathway protein GspK [Luteibacter yeojuensis]